MRSKESSPLHRICTIKKPGLFAKLHAAAAGGIFSIISSALPHGGCEIHFAQWVVSKTLEKITLVVA